MNSTFTYKLFCKLFLFCFYFGYAQTDSVFLSWSFPAPFRMDLPKAHYYHFSDTLTNPWQAYPWPSPNTGQFLIYCNRWKDQFRLIVKNDSATLMDELVEVRDFYYKPPLDLKPGYYTVSIVRSERQVFNHRMGVMPPDTVMLRKDRQRAEYRKNIKPVFSVWLSPNPCDGNFAIVIGSGDCDENESLKVELCNKEGKLIKQVNVKALKSVALIKEQLPKGEYQIKVWNSRKELCLKKIIVQ